jgi:hypothetical protein
MKLKPPFETYVLVIMLIILSIGAIYGGLSLINDPSGDNLQLNLEEYQKYPFKESIIPGTFLFLVFGLFPLSLIYPLFSKPKMPWANTFNIYRRHHWAWSYSLCVGVLLIIWIDVQIWMLGYISFLQIFYSLYGLAIILMSLTPRYMKFYAKTRVRRNFFDDDAKDEL